MPRGFRFAEVQSLQQQHLAQALSALLDANGQTAQGGTAGLAGSQLNLLTLEVSPLPVLAITTMFYLAKASNVAMSRPFLAKPIPG